MRIAKAKNVTPDERKLVEKWTKRCLREMSKREHEITNFRGKQVVLKDMQAGLSVYVKAKSQRSNGGRAQITIDVRDCLNRASRDGRFFEYKALADDPVIGSIDVATQEQCIAVIVAHEVAHHIQRRYGPNTRWLKKTCARPHGQGFQDIYRILRRNVVNPFIEAESNAA